MKKVLALVMACVLMLGMTVQAFATGTSQSHDLTVSTSTKNGTVDESILDDSVLGFEINWSSTVIQIVRVENYGYRWDPDTLKYVQDDSVVEYTYENTVSPYSVHAVVTNKSLVEVTATMEIDLAEGFEDLSVTLGGAKTAVLSAAAPNSEDITAEGTKGGTADIYFALPFRFDGVYEKIYESIEKGGSNVIGTITVSIAANE